MKTKLIQIEDYLLLIDEEAEIKEGNYYLTYLGNIYQETKRPFEEDEGVERFTNRNSYKCILAYYPLSEEAKELNLPLLPNPFEEEVNIEKLAKEIFPNSIFGESVENKRERIGFIEGYKAAQSSNKQYSLEDVKKAIKMAKGLDIKSGVWYKGDAFSEEEIIQSLSTQRLPKEFIPEAVTVTKGTSEFDFYEEDVIKTITNSEGKQVLAGTYKY